MIVERLYQAFLQPSTQSKLATARLFLACSGGRDSLALAYACWQLYQQQKIAQLPILLHIHHGWQTANDDWAKLVKSWADQYGFECRVLTVCLDKKTETDARDKRYQALLSQMSDGDVLMLAHHANDQAETVLMRLADGAGLTGLSAMKTWQSKRNAQKRIWLWRPLLQMARVQISQFAIEQALPFVDDLTNFDTRTIRGQIRTQILPMLAKLNPNAVQNIARSASLLEQERQIVNDVVSQALSSLAWRENQGLCLRLDIARFVKLPVHLQTSVLYAWLKIDARLSPNHQFVQTVQSLIERADSNHQTVLFWQVDEQAFYLCRYDGVLYRYQGAMWQALQGVSQQLVGTDGAFELAFGELIGRWQAAGACLEYAQKIDHQHTLHIGKHHYRAKKLYQKIRLPVWLRSHLWQVKIRQGDQQRSYLLAPMYAYDLTDGRFDWQMAQVWQFCTKHDNRVKYPNHDENFLHGA